MIYREAIPLSIRKKIESWDLDGRPVLPPKPEAARALLMERPRVVDWVNKPAQLIAQDLDKEFTEQSGN